MTQETEKVKQHYRRNRETIEARLTEFEEVGRGSEERWFQELVYVILSSQSSARAAWKAAEKLGEKGCLEKDENEIKETLSEFNVSYEREKAAYIVENREKLSQPTLGNPEKKLKLKSRIESKKPRKARKWLVENIQGISWKGASHFLRNIGQGDDFAIISSHILKKLSSLGVIEEASTPENEQEYLEIERKMRELAEQTDIELKALDLVLWSMETGEIFK